MNNHQPIARSWTFHDTPKTNKWLPMGLLLVVLAVAVYLFFTLIQLQEKPNSFFVSIAITEYDEKLLPQPAYADWTWDSICGSLVERGLEEIAEAPRSNFPNSKSEFENLLGELRDQLLQADIRDQDTVWVYLRGHALSIDDEPYLLTNEVTQESIRSARSSADARDSKQPLSAHQIDGAVPISYVLRSLAHLPAENVVLLADVFDLRSVPELGVLANNVPELLAREIAGVDAETNLWVLTSTSALQTAHLSLLCQQTLTQTACEYAVNASRGDKEAGFVSLQTLYDGMLRYCHHVTRGKQTPLLFRSGSAQRVTESSLAAWNAAGNVRLAEIGDQPATIPEEKAQARTPAASELPFGYLVANRGSVQGDDRADPPPEDDDDSGGQLEESDASSPRESESKALEQSTWLRFWQLRDRLSGRQNLVGWSPADFAAGAWRRLQLDAVRLKRLKDLGERGNERVMLLHTQALSQLDDALRTDRNGLMAAENRRVDSASLLAAWDEFRESLTPESGRLAWLQPEALPTSVQERWLKVRDGYRQYSDAMASLGGWQRLALYSEAPNRSTLLEYLDEFTASLVELDSELPRDDESIMDRASPSLSVEKIDDGLDKLRKALTSHVSDLHAQLRNASTEKIDWRAEHFVQALLWDPQLEYGERKMLQTAYDALSVEQLERPGEDIAVDTNRRLGDLLEDSLTAEQTAGHLVSWANVYARGLGLGTMVDLPKPRNRTSNVLNRWFQRTLRTLRPAPPADSLQRWKRGCLYIPGEIAPAGKASAGLILAVSNDTELEPELPSQVKLPGPLVCKLKLRNGTPVRNCFFQWELGEPKVRQSLGATDPLSVRLLSSNRQLAPDVPHEISVQGGKISLALETGLDQDIFGKGLSVHVRVAKTEEKLSNRLPHKLSVTLPNPNRVDIYVKNLNAAQGDSPWVFAKHTKIGGLISALETPAISGNAASEYELYAVNRSDRDKTVRIRVFDPKSNQPVGIGRVDVEAAESVKRNYSSRLSPIFTSQKVSLPKNPGAKGNVDLTARPEHGKRVALQRVSETESSDAQSPLSAGEFGLLCVVEEVAEEENNTVRRLNREPHFHWLECIPQNPYGSLVEINPLPKEGGFLLQLQGIATEWKRWNLRELPVQARVTDLHGNPVEHKGKNTVKLTADELSARLTLGVSEPPTTRYFAHVDIGGYSRAIAFESRLQGNWFETRSSSQPFAWLTADELRLIPADGSEPRTPVTLPGQSNAFVIPVREQVSATSDGLEISFERCELPFEIELPTPQHLATLELNERRKTFEYDRRFEPKFDLNEGNLVFRAAVTPQLKFSPQIPRGEFTGRNSVTLKLLPNGPTRSAELVFDNQPPIKSAVQRNRPELYLGEELEISTIVEDADSAIAQVYFAISNGGEAARYRPSDQFHMEAQPNGDRWSYFLKADDLEDRAEGRYVLVCRTVDLAGNIQDENTPRSFRWIRRERPKAPE